MASGGELRTQGHIGVAVSVFGFFFPSRKALGGTPHSERTILILSKARQANATTLPTYVKYYTHEFVILQM